MGQYRVLGISGSLRKQSYNSSLLRAAVELAPKELEITIADLSEIPLYNDDVREKGYPAPVEKFRKQIASAQAVLIATPEYNYSVPGVLKNAIDWASRPPEQPFEGKPIALMGASPGLFGTARAQYHLRQVFVFMNSFILNRPEVMVGSCQAKFDGEGKLTDEKSREVLQKMLVAFVDHITHHGPR